MPSILSGSRGSSRQGGRPKRLPRSRGRYRVLLEYRGHPRGGARHGAEAIHPGYGFLSENPRFASAVEEAGLVFVGPPAAAIDQMGDKAEARRIAADAGVPVIPGYDEADQSTETLLAEAKRIGFPLLLKPAAGGGGKGDAPRCEPRRSGRSIGELSPRGKVGVR